MTFSRESGHKKLLSEFFSVVLLIGMFLVCNCCKHTVTAAYIAGNSVKMCYVHCHIIFYHYFQKKEHNIF